MSTVGVLHLIFLSIWGGVLFVEFVLEIVGGTRDSSEQERVAVIKLHYWTDVLIEIPVIFMVFLTGVFLVDETWPLPPLLKIKIAAALIAIGFNLYCAAFVILRYRNRHDLEKVLRYQKHIQWSVVGVPFGALSAYLGLTYFL